MKFESLRYDDYAPVRRKEGLTDLSMIENPLGPSKLAVAAVAKASDRINRYSPVSRELVRTIAEVNEVPEEEVLVTDGADGALTLSFLAFVNKGDKVAVPVPTFPRFRYYCELAESRMVPYGLTDKLILREDELLSSGCGVLALCSPNNPTGIPASRRFLEEALDAFKLVIVDEALLCFENHTADLARNHENLVITRSFSKLFGLAGMRVGYAIAHPKKIAALAALSSPFKVSSLAQVAATETLADHKYIESSRDHVRKELVRLRRLRRKSTIRESETLCYLVSLEKGDLERLRKDHIVVTPGHHFDKLDDGSARVSLGSREQNSQVLSVLG